MPSINKPWAIVLCKFTDRPAEPLPPQYFIDLFTQNGAGGICDYWRAASCGALDISNSQVFGWFDVGHSAGEATSLSVSQGSNARPTFVAWARNAAAARGINLARFSNVLALYGSSEPDHGAAPGTSDVVIALKRASLFEFGFTCHEMGHGFGLGHSWSANPDLEYGDGWDVMSWQTSTYNFGITFEGTTEGLATVGLNAHNLDKLGALPPGRTWAPVRADFSERVTLDALGQPPVGNHGYLVGRIAASATLPTRSNGSAYTIEFRRKVGWDQAIPSDAIVCHEVRTNGISYLQPLRGTSFSAGQTFTTPDPKVFVHVERFDAGTSSAVLRIWDMPDGCLRKEDSTPEVYQISGGTKHLIPSPAVLTAIGKTWADVRTVPDGGLASLLNGAAVATMQLTVSPYPVPLEVPVSLTVQARDSVSGLVVAGEVIVDNIRLADANTAFTHTFHRTRRIVVPKPPQYLYISPAGVVRAKTGHYPQAKIDFGFPPPGPR